MKKVIFRRTLFNSNLVVLLITSVIGVFFYALSNEIPEELIFKVWVVIWATPFIWVYVIFEIYTVSKYPREVSIDAKQESLLFGDDIALFQSNISFGLIKQTMGNYSLYIEVVSGQKYNYKPYYSAVINSIELQEILKHFPKIKVVTGESTTLLQKT
ncbi:hypothetical protein E5672_10170 [Alteromonas portus]|uniref:Uncharacterized protein n=1 Tax=Alteromonas portus TaxID=2565549 RepID=A0A4V5NNF4_9ALTE|nr:hypothetical protein [Alteromonas portus]TKB03396.1 hypothetical protein E5672_10170 [Alteromonas portus]